MSAAVERSDGDDSSDDDNEEETDDEFVSSGEVAEHYPPIHISISLKTSSTSCEPASKLTVNLPSMLNTDWKMELHTPTSPGPEKSPAFSRTAEELQQPVLDLSFSDSSSSIHTVADEREKGVDGSIYDHLGKGRSFSESFSQLESVSDSKRVIGCQTKRAISDLSPDDTDHLVETTRETGTYQPKRRKTRDVDASPMLDETLTEQKCDDMACGHVSDLRLDLSPPVTCIDLTTTSPSDQSNESGPSFHFLDLTQEEVTHEEEGDGQVRNEQTPTPVKGGSASPQGSPSFLPPTPGREASKSILMRKSIAFM